MYVYICVCKYTIDGAEDFHTGDIPEIAYWGLKRDSMNCNVILRLRWLQTPLGRNFYVTQVVSSHRLTSGKEGGDGDVREGE